jgi:pyruvate formate lyase activating enzyme
VAAVLFTKGCNLRCPYCHNPELVTGPTPDDFIDLEEALTYLRKRRNVLSGVCITGGEPLIHDELPSLVDRIHALGLKVKLDTNGTLPERLRQSGADFFAMDVKTSLSRYHLVTPSVSLLGAPRPEDLERRVKESITWILAEGLPHEFRTTVVPGIVRRADIEAIVKEIRGTDRYVLAGFRPAETLDPAYADVEPPAAPELEELCRLVVDRGLPCGLRMNTHAVRSLVRSAPATSPAERTPRPTYPAVGSSGSPRTA